jgi:hypothetical protein
MRAGIILFIASAALAGCWNGGQGTPITSIDSATVIGDLDDAGFLRLCHDIDHWNESEFGSAQFRSSLCEMEAATALRRQLTSPATEQTACRQMALACESSRQGMPNIAPRCHRGPTRCALKVADLERCLDDLSYDINLVLCSAPMCDDICGIVDGRAADPPSCADVEAACPDLQFTRPSFEWLEELDPCVGAGPMTRECVWHN